VRVDAVELAAVNLDDRLNRLEKALIDVERAFYGVNAAAEMFATAVRQLTGVAADDDD
jgi:hypothetical protein